jgi:CRP/FNR family transcriptional regulator
VALHAGRTIAVDPAWSTAMEPAATPDLPALLSGLPLTRIRVPDRAWLFHAGQPHPAVYYVQAGFLKTSVGSEDGRERITAFSMRGDWLGLESLAGPSHVSDCIALDACEVWQLPADALERADVASTLARACARQLREQQAWTLAMGSLGAERRVAAFLEDLGDRHAALGCSSVRFRLRMTRSEIGNFLGLQIETVTRALTKLQASGHLRVDRRDITLLPGHDARPVRAVRSSPAQHAAVFA